MAPGQKSHVLRLSAITRWPRFNETAVTVGLVALTLLTVLIGLYTASQVWRRPFFGFVFDMESGQVLDVSPGGPASRTDIRPGDILTHIDGTPLREARPLYRNPQAGTTVQYTFARNGSSYEAAVKLASVPQSIWASEVARLALGAVFWLLGLTAFVQRRQDQVAQTFFLVCLYAAGAIWVVPLTLWQEEWARRAVYLFVLLTGASFLHFHLLFPRPLPRDQRRKVLWVTYLIAGVGIAVTLLIGPFRLEDWTRTVLGTGSTPGNLLRLYFIMTVGAGLLLLLFAYRDGSGSTRRRVRLIVFGTVLGCLPLLLLFTAEIMGYLTLPYDLAMISLVLIPLAYTTSIRQSDLMVVDAILYRVLVFVLVGMLLLVGYLALITVAGYLHPRATQTPLLGAFASLLVALSLSPVQRAVQLSLSRLFYGAGYDYMEVVSDSIRVLSTTLDRTALVEVLTTRVPAAMNVGHTGLWLSNHDGCLEWIGGNIASSSEDNMLCLPPRLRERLRTGMLVQHADNMDLPGLSGPVRWWVPLMLADELQGVWAIGPRFNDESFGPVERRLMRATAQEAALVVKVILLLTQLRYQLDLSEADRQELRQAYSQLVAARDDERSRLARELHDEVLQGLYGIDLCLDQARLGAPSALAGQLKILQGQTQHMLASARTICQGLRPIAVLTHGLPSAMQRLADEVSERAKIRVKVITTPHGARASEEIETALYRIVQEALNNVVKHSHSPYAEVHLELRENEITLSIEDDGVGFDEAALTTEQGMGLTGMRERVAALGGRLLIETAPGCGTAIEVHIPC